ncbi:MAG: hypothetical protein LBP68_02410 [Acidobacteriota bacterium]|nr:hypothetical protein [Acidobacteriota bacterium]
MAGKTKILWAVVGALVVIVLVLLVSPMLFNRGSGASAFSARETPASPTGANVGIVVDHPGDEMLYQQFFGAEAYQGAGPVTELPAGTVIDGYPVARGQFNEAGELKAFYSSAPIEFHGDTFPTGTWIGLKADQRIATVVFPEDTTIQGYRIRGGYADEVKVDSYGIALNFSLKNLPPSITQFYPDGQLRIFNSRKDVMVQDIPCMGNSFVDIRLRENGELQGCTVARDVTVGGVSLNAGEGTQRNAQGQLQRRDTNMPWPLKTAARLSGWWEHIF